MRHMRLLSTLRNLLNPPHRPLKLTVTNAASGAVLADKADVADTSSSRKRGLLKHGGLAAGEGIWIVPCSGVHSFGMKFDIDLVYLDREYHVRKLRNAMKPGRMSLCLRAHSVLELPSGTIERTRTRAGQRLQLEFSEIDWSTAHA
jgi:uncharacterized protein